MGPVDVQRIVTGPALAAAAATLVMLALRDSLVVAAVAAGVAYAVLLVAFERRFYPDDARAIRDFLRQRRIPSYQ